MKLFYAKGEPLSDAMAAYMPSEVELIDVVANPLEAEKNSVVAVPMLVRGDGAIKIGLMDELEFYEWMK
mgnify:CR=1 FL=1